MKKLLSIIGAISLITSGSSNLIGCNNTPTLTSEELSELKEKNSKTINGNKLEWIAPQEKPFNTVDNKWYVVIWRGDQNNAWNINKFYNSSVGSYYVVDEKSQIQLLFKNNEYFFGIKEFYNDKSKNKITISKNEVLNVIKEFDIYDIDNNHYIKSVYRWDEKNEPLVLKINSDGEIEN